MCAVSKTPGNFRASDVLLCTRCSGEMRLTRRTPHPEFGIKYEEQSFAYKDCGRVVTRAVNEDGKRPAEQIIARLGRADCRVA